VCVCVCEGGGEGGGDGGGGIDLGICAGGLRRSIRMLKFSCSHVLAGVSIQG
jgi:hypothetical protein